jgi:chaperonin GroEL
MNPMDLKRGIDLGRRAVATIDRQAVPISQKNARSRKVGDDLANGDAEIGEMIAEAMEKVGKDGVITVEEARA